MSKQDTIISLLKEIDENIDNVGSVGNIPKIKVNIIRIDNMSIDENGQWIGGEFIDFSSVSSMNSFAKDCTIVKNFDNVIWNFDKNSKDWTYAFYNCINLTHLDFTNGNKIKVTKLWNAFTKTSELTKLNGLDKLDVSDCTDFNGCIAINPLEKIDITSWDFKSAAKITSIFNACYKLKSFIGDRTIDEVLRDNVKAFTNAKVSIALMGSGIINAIERPSLRALINGIADLTGQTAQTLTIGEALIAKLTEEDIAIATAKNWTIA